MLSVRRIASLAVAPLLVLVLAGVAIAQPNGTITSITPASGPTAGGTTITILGTDLYYGTSGPAVTIAGATAPVTSWRIYGAFGETEIIAITPLGAAGPADVRVVTADPQYEDRLLALSPGAFTYVAPVPAITVTGVSPASGLTTGGEAVTITGTGFSGGSAPTVSLGGTAATGVTVVSNTTITATTPARAAGTVDVSVSRDGAAGTRAGAYRYEQGYWLTVTNSQPPGTGSSTEKSTGAVRSAAFGDWTSRETVQSLFVFTTTTYRSYAGGINCGNRLERKSVLASIRIFGAETVWGAGPCRYAVRAGTSVRLSALPSSATSLLPPLYFDDHWVGLFNRWTGDCTDTTSECSVTMNSDRSVRAAWGRFSWGLISGSVAATPEFAADGKLTYAVFSVGFVPTVTGSPGGQTVSYTMQSTFTTGASAAARSTAARRVPACRGTARFVGRLPSATQKTTRGRLEARCTPTPALAAALRKGTVRVTASWYLRAPRQKASYPLGQARAHLANRRAGAVTG